MFKNAAFDDTKVSPKAAFLTQNLFSLPLRSKNCASSGGDQKRPILHLFARSAYLNLTAAARTDSVAMIIQADSIAASCMNQHHYLPPNQIFSEPWRHLFLHHLQHRKKDIAERSALAVLACKKTGTPFIQGVPTNIRSKLWLSQACF